MEPGQGNKGRLLGGKSGWDHAQHQQLRPTAHSYLHLPSSSQLSKNSYLITAAVLWRLTHSAQPPSPREGSMSLLTDATTSNAGRAATFKHWSLSSIAMLLFCQSSLCCWCFFILSEVSCCNAYKYTNSFTFIFNESFKPQRLEIFSTMMYFALEVIVMQWKKHFKTRTFILTLKLETKWHLGFDPQFTLNSALELDLKQLRTNLQIKFKHDPNCQSYIKICSAEISTV